MNVKFPSSRARLRSSTRGAIMVEFLIAYMPVLVGFLMFWQLGELIVAKLVVERASSAAGRAAVVVLPDDAAFYDGDVQDTFAGNRKRQIRMAAGMILQASPHISENFTVDVSNPPVTGDRIGTIKVRVDAEYRCNVLQWVCGATGVTILHAETEHAYQGARYDYEPMDLSSITTPSGSTDPSCSGSDTPGAGGSGNGTGSGGKGSGGNG